jgi:hypothetical protein
MSANDFRFWLFLLVAVFLFWGDPDVYDKVHDYAMHLEVCR